MFVNTSYVQQNMLKNGITAQQQKQNCINVFPYPAPLSSEMCGPKSDKTCSSSHFVSFENLKIENGNLRITAKQPSARGSARVHCSLGHPWVCSASQLKRDFLLWKN